MTKKRRAVVQIQAQAKRPPPAQCKDCPGSPPLAQCPHSAAGASFLASRAEMLSRARVGTPNKTSASSPRVESPQSSPYSIPQSYNPYRGAASLQSHAYGPPQYGQYSQYPGWAPYANPALGYPGPPFMAAPPPMYGINKSGSHISHNTSEEDIFASTGGRQAAGTTTAVQESDAAPTTAAQVTTASWGSGDELQTTTSAAAHTLQIDPALSQDDPALSQDDPALSQDDPAPSQDDPALSQDGSGGSTEYERVLDDESGSEGEQDANEKSDSDSDSESHASKPKEKGAKEQGLKEKGAQEKGSKGKAPRISAGNPAYGHVAGAMKGNKSFSVYRRKPLPAYHEKPGRTFNRNMPNIIARCERLSAETGCYLVVAAAHRTGSGALHYISDATRLEALTEATEMLNTFQVTVGALKRARGAEAKAVAKELIKSEAAKAKAEAAAEDARVQLAATQDQVALQGELIAQLQARLVRNNRTSAGIDNEGPSETNEGTGQTNEGAGATG